MTNSLLGFTTPKVRREEAEKAKLSAYILDEESVEENSFEPLSARHFQKQGQHILPGSILETNDELTNLYKTISRKQILSKVQGSPSYNINSHQENKVPR